jgi:hypothetical protein
LQVTKTSASARARQTRRAGLFRKIEGSSSDAEDSIALSEQTNLAEPEAINVEGNT